MQFEISLLLVCWGLVWGDFPDFFDDLLLVFVHLFLELVNLPFVLFLHLLVLLPSLLVDLGNGFHDLIFKLLDWVSLDVFSLRLVLIKLIHPLEHLPPQDSKSTFQFSLGLIFVSFKSFFGGLKQYLNIHNWFHDKQKFVILRYVVTAREASDEVFVRVRHREFVIQGKDLLLLHYRAVRADHDCSDHVYHGNLSDKGSYKEESPAHIPLWMVVETCRGRLAETHHVLVQQYVSG